jgi:hypothetical protein
MVGVARVDKADGKLSVGSIEEESKRYKSPTYSV